MISQFKFENGMFSFLDGEGSGWRQMQFEFNGELCSSENWAVECSGDETAASAQFPGRKEWLRFRHDPREHSLIVSRRIENTGNEPLRFESVSDGLLSAPSEVCFSRLKMHYAKAQKLRWLHSGNLRIEKFPDFRPDYPYLRVLPAEEVHFNHCEANNIPAFLICDDEYRLLLIEGDLNQMRFERSWRLKLRCGRFGVIPGVCKGTMRYPLSDGFVLNPGESAEVSKVFYQLKENSHPQDAFTDYVSALGREAVLYGSRSPMLHGAVYCTWNYGVFGDITEDVVLERARILRRELPGCTHFLIDDGYQAKRNGRNAGFCSFYPDPARGFEPSRFPKGMKFVADELKKMGLVPALWLSPRVYLDSDLAKEKPEWLLKDASGSPDLLDHTSFLDLSNREAREFFLRIIDTLYVDWGFKGIKFDFMSQWFLLEKARFGSGSGLEWRNFVFEEVRKRIGDDGLFMTCIAMSMGNPVPGRWADCYRCGCDIHLCTWQEQKRACLSTLPQILQEGRRTMLLNMDSAGVGDIPENEIYFRFNWVFITQGILELGGKFETLAPERLAMFRRLLENIDRGHRVRCPDERAFTGDGLPEILEVEYPEDSVMYRSGVKKHLAFFNWNEQKKCIGLPIGAKSFITEFWSGKKIDFCGDFLSAELSPHSSAMFAVR